LQQFAISGSQISKITTVHFNNHHHETINMPNKNVAQICPTSKPLPPTKVLLNNLWVHFKFN